MQKVARELKQKGIDATIIAAVTKLTEEEIKKLRPSWTPKAKRKP
jgi:SOS response regulatory protein OraA/RecX